MDKRLYLNIEKKRMTAGTEFEYVRSNIYPWYNLFQGVIWPYSMLKNILPYIILKTNRVKEVDVEE